MSLRNCVCDQPRPRQTPGKEQECVVCGFHVPKEWRSSVRLPDIFQRLLRGFGHNVPASAEQARDQCFTRNHDGQRHFGYRFHARDNLRMALEEGADWLNYLAYRVIVKEKRGDQEGADRTYAAMMKVLEAYDATCSLEQE